MNATRLKLIASLVIGAKLPPTLFYHVVGNLSDEQIVEMNTIGRVVLGYHYTNGVQQHATFVLQGEEWVYMG